MSEFLKLVIFPAFASEIVKLTQPESVESVVLNEVVDLCTAIAVPLPESGDGPLGLAQVLGALQ